MPSLVIGLVAAVIVGWLMVSFVKSDGLTSIWVSAIFATVAAIVIRLLIKTVSFSGD